MRASKAKTNTDISTVRGKLISISEAVEKTTLGKDWFYKHMEAGTLPFPWFQLSVGKRVIDTADLDDWLYMLKVPAGKKKGEQ